MSDILNEVIDITPIFRGGQKQVYKGDHTKLGEVVIKKGNYESNSSLERIKREVDCLRNIDSHYYPKHYYFYVDETNKTFVIVEQYINSVNLTKAMSNFDTEIKIVKLLKNLCIGLKVLWDKNIVHRDLKPDNILITPELEPRIIDLGIARFLDYSSLTKTVYPMGPCTPVYASPEQLLNKKEIIDIRTDFFSLGIIILQLWHGFHPFHPDKVNSDKDIPVNICEGLYLDPRAKEGASDQFVSLIKRLLMKEPYERFRNYTKLFDFISTNWGEV